MQAHLEALEKFYHMYNNLLTKDLQKITRRPCQKRRRSNLFNCKEHKSSLMFTELIPRNYT